MQSMIKATAAFYLSLVQCPMLAARAIAQPNRPQTSRNAIDQKRQDFFALSRSQVLRQSGAGTSRDRLVIGFINSAIKHITSPDEPDYLSCRGTDIHIVTRGGSRFHPIAGVLIDSTEIRDLARELPTNPLAFVALFVVAHECGHALQFKRYPLLVMENGAYGRFIESQADLLAGMEISRPLKTTFLMKNGTVIPRGMSIEPDGFKFNTFGEDENRDWTLIAKGGITFSRLAQSIGGPEGYDTSEHAPPAYRAHAVLTGLYIGCYLKSSDESRLPGGSDSQAVAEDWKKEYSLVPSLPDIGVIDVFEWSRNATKQFLSEEEILADFPEY